MNIGNSSKILLIALGVIAATPVPAHETDRSVEEILVDEIRLLREDLRKMATANLQASLLLERVRIQSELVGNLARQVEDRERDRMYQDMEREAGWANDYESQLRERLESATGQTRTELERELQNIRRRVEMEERRRMQEETRFIELQRRLDEERARLDELFEEISALQRGLD